MSTVLLSILYRRHIQTACAVGCAFVMSFTAAVCVSPAMASNGDDPDENRVNVDASAVGTVIAAEVFHGWGEVTRDVSLMIPQQEVVRIGIRDLPDKTDPASFRSSVPHGVSILSISPLIVADVEKYDAQLASIAADLDRLHALLQPIDEERDPLLRLQTWYDSLSERTANRISQTVGGGTLDFEELTTFGTFLVEKHQNIGKQLAALDTQRDTIITQITAAEKLRETLRNEGPKSVKWVVMELDISGLLATQNSDESNSSESVSGLVPLSVQLSYAVEGIDWQPSYTIRCEDVANSRAVMEFDIIVYQNTGERWDSIKLSASTGQTADAYQPIDVKPWPIRAHDNRGSAEVNLNKQTSLGVAALPNWGAEISNWDAEQNALRNKATPITSFDIADPVSIDGFGEAARSGVRVRFTRMTLRPNFRYIAIPLMSDRAYLVGAVRNSSQIRLIPGSTALFIKSEYMGSTVIPNVDPGSEFEIVFGNDASIRTYRIRKSRRYKTTGLLGDGRETISQYEITIRNQNSTNIPIEVWDRIPISHDDSIRISLVDVNPSISKGSVYESDQRAKGMLKWWLNDTQRETQIIRYTVSVSHHRDIQPTELPE